MQPQPLYFNKINFSGLFVTGASIISTGSTFSYTLNVVGNLSASGISLFALKSNLIGVSAAHQLSINNINATSTTILGNLNSFSTAAQLSINNTNATSTTLFNKTNFSGLNITGNVDCGGTISITGANANANTKSVDAANITNTYVTFKEAGAASDWCYLRQIGATNAYKLALDFFDDGNDARFVKEIIIQ